MFLNSRHDLLCQVRKRDDHLQRRYADGKSLRGQSKRCTVARAASDITPKPLCYKLKSHVLSKRVVWNCECIPEI